MTKHFLKIVALITVFGLSCGLYNMLAQDAFDDDQNPERDVVNYDAAEVSEVLIVPEAEDAYQNQSADGSDLLVEEQDSPASPPADSAEAVPGFEIDRTPPENGTDEVADEESAPRVSFWRRLFGRGPKKDDMPVEPQPAEVVQEQSDADAALAPDTPPSPEAMLAAREEVRRQAREMEALQNMEQGQELMQRNEFEQAVSSFAKALELMPNRPHTVDLRDQLRQNQAECEYRIAMNHYKDGNIPEARNALRRSLGYYPGHVRSMKLNERLRDEDARRQEIALKPVPLRKTPEHQAKLKTARDAITRGNQYMAMGEYDKAEREFQLILQDDPTNTDVIAQLGRLAERRFARNTKSMESVQKDMVAKVRDTWSTTDKRLETQPRDMREDDGDGRATGTRRRLMEKLSNILIPSLDFRQANIHDVIKYIDQQAAAADTESPPSERGVNIVLNLRRPGQASAAPVPVSPADDPFADVGLSQPMAPGVPTVTLSLRNVYLLDAIRFITEMTGLRYRIENDVVLITPADMVVGEIITRTYKVQPGVISEHIMTAPAPSSGGGLFDLGGPGAATGGAGGGDIRQFFVDAGVPFPEGTSIVYRPSMNLIIVSNNAENLEKFERILNMLNVVPVQVEIEARFVEVQQTDVEELGMEWLLTDNWVVAQESGPGAPLPVTARERVQVNQNNLTKGLRFYEGSGENMIPQTRGTAAGILSISSVLTSPQLSVILHALEQRDGANLLSAPKVTTKTGSNAEIKIVRELIYPTDWRVVESTAPTQTQPGTPGYVVPENFEQRDMGVILNVTPTVGPDNYTIDLVMMPQVVELQEWINYGTLIPDGAGGFMNQNIPQPIFHSRTIITSISIWDGQTVVMGGLITEGQQTSEDKIPFLGDIPLLGWFFRTKSTKSVKRNLLIFVTANLVDPAGNKINQETEASVAGPVTVVK
ncbi:MAG: hypothetical protein LC725_07155 [Lentisphaerae bacterium]|nr:hypothetical protein [Lentisphaerota bacterium]